MKTITLILLMLLLLPVSAREFKFNFDDSIYKWRPVVDVTTVPYYLPKSVEHVRGYVKVYSIQAGMKYKFNNNDYIQIKAEYATDYAPGMTGFSFKGQSPIIIVEFRSHF